MANTNSDLQELIILNNQLSHLKEALNQGSIPFKQASHAFLEIQQELEPFASKEPFKDYFSPFKDHEALIITNPRVLDFHFHGLSLCLKTFIQLAQTQAYNQTISEQLTEAWQEHITQASANTDQNLSAPSLAFFHHPTQSNSQKNTQDEHEAVEAKLRDKRFALYQKQKKIRRLIQEDQNVQMQKLVNMHKKIANDLQLPLLANAAYLHSFHLGSSVIPMSTPMFLNGKNVDTFCFSGNPVDWLFGSSKQSTQENPTDKPSVNQLAVYNNDIFPFLAAHYPATEHLRLVHQMQVMDKTPNSIESIEQFFALQPLFNYAKPTTGNAQDEQSTQKNESIYQSFFYFSNPAHADTQNPNGLINQDDQQALNQLYTLTRDHVNYHETAHYVDHMKGATFEWVINQLFDDTHIQKQAKPLLYDYYVKRMGDKAYYKNADDFYSNVIEPFIAKHQWPVFKLDLNHAVDQYNQQIPDQLPKTADLHDCLNAATNQLLNDFDKQAAAFAGNDKTAYHIFSDLYANLLIDAGSKINMIDQRTYFDEPLADIWALAQVVRTSGADNETLFNFYQALNKFRQTITPQTPLYFYSKHQAKELKERSVFKLLPTYFKQKAIDALYNKLHDLPYALNDQSLQSMRHIVNKEIHSKQAYQGIFSSIDSFFPSKHFMIDFALKGFAIHHGFGDLMEESFAKHNFNQWIQTIRTLNESELFDYCKQQQVICAKKTFELFAVMQQSKNDHYEYTRRFSNTYYANDNPTTYIHYLNQKAFFAPLIEQLIQQLTQHPETIETTVGILGDPAFKRPTNQVDLAEQTRSLLADLDPTRLKVQSMPLMPANPTMLGMAQSFLQIQEAGLTKQQNQALDTYLTRLNDSSIQDANHLPAKPHVFESSLVFLRSLFKRLYKPKNIHLLTAPNASDANTHLGFQTNMAWDHKGYQLATILCSNTFANALFKQQINQAKGSLSPSLQEAFDTLYAKSLRHFSNKQQLKIELLDTLFSQTNSSEHNISLKDTTPELSLIEPLKDNQSRPLRM